MKTRTKIVIGTFIFILILVVLVSFYVWINLYSPVMGVETATTFEIKEGQKVVDIVDSLEDAGLIRNKLVTLSYLKITGKGSKLKAGFYSRASLPKAFKPIDVIDLIVSGETAMRSITILEGWKSKDIAAYLDDRNIVSKQNFLVSLEKQYSYDFLDGIDNLEGYLYPDTYYIPYNATSEDIIKVMLDNFDKKLDKELKEEIKTQEKTISEIVTMASIVEKEVFKKEDRQMVAGIFWARISEEMPLQSDATINYITGLDKSSPSYEETRRGSPYNTYLNKGLPPGPICNPSIESIKAAIYPKMTNYKFYLNRQDTGETIFSRTYEEHLENKYKYLK